jgi:hypothetical protein
MWLFVGIAAALVLFGDLYILERTYLASNPTFLIRDDALHYIEMAETGSLDVSPPFRFRVLVPFLVGALPFPTLISFKIVTYSSLFGCYLLALMTCRGLGFSITASILGLLSFYFFRIHFVLYNNPYLTDAVGLFALFLMLYAVLHRHYLTFLAAIGVGTLARETTLFLTPLWLITGQWRRAILAIVVGFGLFLGSRYLIATPAVGMFASVTTAEDLNRLGSLSNIYILANNIVLSWNFVWGFMLLGLVLLPGRAFLTYGTAFVLLFGGSFVAVLNATDIGRLFLVMSPVVVVACAQLYTTLQSVRWLYGAAVVLMLSRGIFAAPTPIIDFDSDWSFVDFLPTKILFVVGGLLCVAIVVVLRDTLWHALKQHIAEVRAFRFPDALSRPA